MRTSIYLLLLCFCYFCLLSQPQRTLAQGNAAQSTATAATATATTLHFTHLTADDGLAQNSVQAILVFGLDKGAHYIICKQRMNTVFIRRRTLKK